MSNISKWENIDSRQVENYKAQKFFYLVYEQFSALKPWYFSPYPSELIVDGQIYLCEYCLTYTKTKTQLKRHLSKCSMHSPPGKEIYRYFFSRKIHYLKKSQK